VSSQSRLNRKVEKLKKKLDVSEKARVESEQSYATIISQLQHENNLLQNQLKDSDARYKRLEESMECALCYEERATIVFAPCHHQAYCSKCNDKHKPQNCPVCRTIVASSFKVYSN
jgi:hypothetical protein